MGESGLGIGKRGLCVGEKAELTMARLGMLVPTLLVVESLVTDNSLGL